MKCWITVISFVLALANVDCACAAPVQFNFKFFDSVNAPIGSGFYRFDDIAPGTKRSFATLTNFSWAFGVPAYNIDLQSANSDIPSTDSIVNEGILLTGLPGFRTLQFFDDSLTYILHQDASETFPSGIEFPEFTNQVSGYFDNGTQLGVGTFTALEVPVPEPATLVLLGAALVSTLLMPRTARRRAS